MEHSLALLVVLSLLLTSTVPATSSEAPNKYTDCATSLSTLEAALYNTGDNKVNLNRYFFPPREEAVPYAKITYQFEDENGTIPEYANSEDLDEGDCTCGVTYVWAVGGFLLIQPPSIFTYTSLLFFHTRQKSISLRLRLPHACRALVRGENGTCSCANKDNNPLDVLSQQVRNRCRIFSDW